jgi:hypothetical protein
VRVHQFAGLDLQPALFLRLAIEFGAGIGRGERNLDRFRVDIAGEFDGLLDRFCRLARQAQDKRAVDLDAQFLARCVKFAGDIDAHALLDVDQDLLVAGFRSRPAAGAGRCPS